MLAVWFLLLYTEANNAGQLAPPTSQLAPPTGLEVSFPHLPKGGSRSPWAVCLSRLHSGEQVGGLPTPGDFFGVVLGKFVQEQPVSAHSGLSCVGSGLGSFLRRTVVLVPQCRQSRFTKENT